MLIKYLYWRYFFVRFFSTFWLRILETGPYTTLTNFSFFQHVYTLHFKNNFYVIIHLFFMHLISPTYLGYEIAFRLYFKDRYTSLRKVKLF